LKTEKFTHKGWFGVCPVYLGDLDTEIPSVTPRYDSWVFTFLFHFSCFMFKVFFVVADALHPTRRFGFPLVVTEELLIPHTNTYEDEED
jgi:hypothetical protein